MKVKTPNHHAFIKSSAPFSFQQCTLGFILPILCQPATPSCEFTSHGEKFKFSQCNFGLIKTDVVTHSREMEMLTWKSKRIVVSGARKGA